MNYFILLAVTLIISSLSLINNMLLDKKNIDKNKFKSKFDNFIYRISFTIPFIWFVEDDDNLTPRGTSLYKKLEISGYLKKYTVRSFMAFKVFIFFICSVGAALTILIANNVSFFSQTLLNIKTETNSLEIKDMILVSAFWLIIPLIPNFTLKQKSKKAIVANNKDIPVLQMFVILMLRANKTVADIIYSLSRLNTVHKEYFEQGYRIYLRDKQEGMKYLKDHFFESRFVETFSLLEDVSEYAKEDCINILEANQKNIIEESAAIKRRNDLSRLIYSQASMFFPFVVLIVLGAIPIVFMGIQMFAQSSNIIF